MKLDTTNPFGLSDDDTEALRNLLQKVGYAIVPIEPTEAMIVASGCALKAFIQSTPPSIKDAWESPAHLRNMLYYAPQKLKSIVRYKAMVQVGRIA